jgi:hypothetical protein
MPLTTGELDRIKSELGFHLLNTGAQPFIGVHMVFEQVIQPYLAEGLDTTSNTIVSVSPSGSAVALTLASVTGITLHSRLAIDVDDFFEMATVRAISGSIVNVILKKAHSLTYTVTLDGGLQQIRECLAALYATQQQLNEDNGTGAIKKVDEIEFYESKQRSALELLQAKQNHWRRELYRRLFGMGDPLVMGCGGFSELY